MNDKYKNEILNHIVGQTVVHENPFDSLETPKNIEPINKEFLNKFIIPIYMNLLGMSQYEENLKAETKKIINEINEDSISIMFGDFNWRTRSSGAFFTAIKNYTEFQDTIGNLLLKSEVCYAGEIYCLALAEMNNKKSVEYLNKYLDYYLTKQELWFDQNQAIGALCYLDKVNNTNELEKHLKNWNKFSSNKPNWTIEESIEIFERNLNCIKEIKKFVSS